MWCHGATGSSFQFVAGTSNAQKTSARSYPKAKQPARRCGKVTGAGPMQPSHAQNGGLSSRSSGAGAADASSITRHHDVYTQRHAAARAAAGSMQARSVDSDGRWLAQIDDLTDRNRRPGPRLSPKADVGDACQAPAPSAHRPPQPARALAAGSWHRCDAVPQALGNGDQGAGVRSPSRRGGVVAELPGRPGQIARLWVALPLPLKR
eukprot:COSAG01_NODE_1720_length_9391_cov_27.761085_12_plen_207_part_00